MLWMNITILTYGSRGDVQPFIPLSLGLMKRGHAVKLAAPARFKSLVEEYGVVFVPLAGDPEELSRRLNQAGYNFIKLLHELFTHAVEIGADIALQTEEACKSADLIVHTFTHVVGAHTLAREMNIPDIHVQTFPMFTPTGDYPNIALPNLKIRALNRLTHLVSRRITWWISRFGYEQVRRRTGLPKRTLYFPFDKDPHHPLTPILCAWSPSLLPPSTDWGTHVHVTGHFSFDAEPIYEPPKELVDFLAAGAPPVCVTFGSMIHHDAEKIDRIVCDAMHQTGQRVIILSGWGRFYRASSQNVLYLESASHDWLLPKCKMVVHHGGAGTTFAGLRAGIPNIVVPFMADQPFWGRCLHATGAGPSPILVKKLSVDALIRALIDAESDTILKHAHALGEKLRNEAGIVHAIQLIEALLFQVEM